VVASKCFQTNFISDKYKTLQSFKLRLLQNSTLVPATVGVLGTFLLAILWKPF